MQLSSSRIKPVRNGFSHPATPCRQAVTPRLAAANRGKATSPTPGRVVRDVQFLAELQNVPTSSRFAAPMLSRPSSPVKEKRAAQPVGTFPDSPPQPVHEPLPGRRVVPVADERLDRPALLIELHQQQIVAELPGKHTPVPLVPLPPLLMAQSVARLWLSTPRPSARPKLRLLLRSVPSEETVPSLTTLQSAGGGPMAVSCTTGSDMALLLESQAGQHFLEAAIRLVPLFLGLLQTHHRLVKRQHVGLRARGDIPAW